jgi:uncharacterized protein YlxW (UPF0749 family)
MNLVGKILVVLILVMSLVWMSWAVMVYATHQNWMEEITRTDPARPGYKVRLDNARADNERLTKERDEAREQRDAERAASRQTLAKLETEKQALATELGQIKAEYDGLKADERKAAAAIEVAQKNLSAAQGEVDKLREEIRTTNTQRDESFRQLVQREDQIHQALGDLTRLQERHKQLTEQVARAKTVLEKLGYSLQTPPDFKPPVVDGVVLAITSSGGGDELVEVSIGSDDGLLVGNTLEVFRDKKYLGRLEILRTSPDRAVAKIDKKLQSGQIQKGDRVATRFKA